MTSLYSKKALLLIPDGSLRTQIESALAIDGITAEQSSVKIGTFELLRREAPRTKGLDFFHPGFFSYVQSVGIPYCIVLNLHSDLSLLKETDPERLLLLQTIILSFITLSLNQQYADLRAHIMIIVDRSSQTRAEEFEKNHALLFKGIASPNEQVNARIELIKNDPAAFHKLFLLRYQKAEDLLKSSVLIVRGFITQIETRYTLEKKLKAYSAPAISAMNDAPVHVVFTIDNQNVSVDGIISPMEEQYRLLALNCFHIIGSLTTKNIRTVTDLIKKSVIDGVGDKRFSGDAEIVVTLLQNCQIDGTAATGMAQLFVSVLSRYKNKRIIASTVNDGILRKSQGYGMIREYIRIDSY